MGLVASLFYALAAILVVGTACLFGGINGLLGGGEAVAARIKRTAGRALLGVCRVRPTVEGLEHVPAEGGFVLISNHESHFDGPFLVGWFPRDFTIVAKRELFRIPVMGWGFRAFGFVEVNRADHAQSVTSMDEATRYLQQGGVVMVFPEGHRTEDGELQAFKKGAFVQALKAQVPLVPVGIAGTRAVLRTRSLRIRPGAVHMRIGEPIPVAGRTVEDREELLAQARGVVARLRAEAKDYLTTTG